MYTWLRLTDGRGEWSEMNGIKVEENSPKIIYALLWTQKQCCEGQKGERGWVGLENVRAGDREISVIVLIIINLS